MAPRASPGGITGPQLTLKKWVMSVSMSCIVRAFTGGDLELELVVAGVGLSLAKIPCDAAGPKVRPGHAPLDGLIDAVRADPLRPPFEDAVLHHLPVILRQAGRKVRDEVPEHPLPASGQICLHAADSKPFRMHASATDGLDDRERALAIVERIKHRRHLSQVLR